MFNEIVAKEIKKNKKKIKKKICTWNVTQESSYEYRSYSYFLNTVFNVLIPQVQVQLPLIAVFFIFFSLSAGK